MADVWVKVCGLRTPDDVAAAEAAGADAVGFVVARSPRQIDPILVRRLSAACEVTTFLVTVDLHPDETESLLATTGVGGLQPHGAHATAAALVAEAAGYEVLLPVPVTGPVRPGEAASGFRALLDRAGSAHGGTGERFDWSLIEPDGTPFVLAGGLGPDNVDEAVTTVRPWGVDASSGLEAAPGRKDHAKIHAFVAAAKAAGKDPA